MRTRDNRRPRSGAWSNQTADSRPLTAAARRRTRGAGRDVMPDKGEEGRREQARESMHWKWQYASTRLCSLRCTTLELRWPRSRFTPTSKTSSLNLVNRVSELPNSALPPPTFCLLPHPVRPQSLGSPFNHTVGSRAVRVRCPRLVLSACAAQPFQHLVQQPPRQVSPPLAAGRGHIVLQLLL